MPGARFKGIERMKARWLARKQHRASRSFSPIDRKPGFGKTALSVQRTNVSVSEDRLVANLSLERTTISDPAGAVLPTLVFLSRRDLMNQNRLFVGNLAYQTAEND